VEALRQHEGSVRLQFKRFDSDYGVRVERPIYVRIKLSIASILVPDRRNHAIWIDDE
jgi:hypothetical protein